MSRIAIVTDSTSSLSSADAAAEGIAVAAEVQGARQVAGAMPEAVRIFIAPPSQDALRTRLVGRGTDDPEQVEARMATAHRELAAQSEFPHVVENDRLEDAVVALEEIVRTATLKR